MNHSFLTLCVCALMLALCGCGGGSSSGSAPASGAQPGEDTLARIKRTGLLKWGADTEGGAPFVYRDEKDTDKIIGFEIDMIEKMAALMGVKQERVQSEWDKLIPNLLSQRTDMVLNGVEINADRAQVVGFSQPYYIYEQQLTVRAADKDKFKSLDDLKGKKIGTLADAEANKVLKKAGFTDEQLVIHPDSTLPYKNLSVGRVDAVLQESIIADFYVGKKPEYHNIPQTFAPGKYAAVVRPADKTLLAEIDRVLTLMKENGELAAIYKKWNMWNDKQKELGIVEKKL